MVSTSARPDESLYDAIVVGYGAVGQATALALARNGLRVAAVEKWAQIFPFPRAGHLDDEILRFAQWGGFAEELDAASWRNTSFAFLDRHGERLFAYDWNYRGPSGWHAHYSMHQPLLEKHMDAAARAAGVDVFRGLEALDVEQDDDEVRVVLQPGVVKEAGGFDHCGEPFIARARWLVGADGAGSAIRRSLDIEEEDLGFAASWLVVFAELEDPDAELPMSLGALICDPERPYVMFRRSGNLHPRWEFHLHDDESPEEMSRPENVWPLLEKFGVTPDNARLLRVAVYRFRSIIAERWRDGRVLLAGDAAHRMPPFMGQGLCSGVRDASGLAWRIGLIQRGVAGPDLLNSYELERRRHVEEVTRLSIGVGEIVDVTDPIKADVRDAELRRQRQDSGPTPLPPLRTGVLYTAAGSTEPQPPAGELFVQGRVRWGECEGRFDDLIGVGWRLLLSRPDLNVPEHLVKELDLIGLVTTYVHGPDRQEPHDLPTETHVVVDLEGVYEAWFHRTGATAVLMRPDFYVFGAAQGNEELDALLEQLVGQLIRGQK